MTNVALIAERLCLTPSGDEFVGGCPCCGYKTGFFVVDKDKRTLFHCHAGGCTQQAIIQVLRKDGLWGGPSSQAAEFPPDRPIAGPPPIGESSNAKAALAMWKRSQPALGTVVETYLRARAYRGPVPISLLYATGEHRSDHQFHPVMLAAAVIANDPQKMSAGNKGSGGRSATLARRVRGVTRS
jgi:hypothetical protein